MFIVNDLFHRKVRKDGLDLRFWSVLGVHVYSCLYNKLINISAIRCICHFYIKYPLMSQNLKI